MTKEDLFLYGAALTAVGGGILGSQFEDYTGPSESDVDKAQEIMEVSADQYNSLPGERECEVHVLGTMITINAINTPSSEELTEDALESVCGPNEDHAELAGRAAEKFKEYREHALNYRQMKKDADVSAGDRFFGVISGAALGFIGLTACAFAGSAIYRSFKKSSH